MKRFIPRYELSEDARREIHRLAYQFGADSATDEPVDIEDLLDYLEGQYLLDDKGTYQVDFGTSTETVGCKDAMASYRKGRKAGQ